MDTARVVIGACMLTSARSADFWLRLCNARHLEGAEALIGAFGRAEEAGKAALQQHIYEYAKAQITQVGHGCRCSRLQEVELYTMWLWSDTPKSLIHGRCPHRHRLS